MHNEWYRFKGQVIFEDETVNLHYWHGRAREGWSPEDGVSINTPLFEGWNEVENISHFQPTLRFMVECQARDFVFTKKDLWRVVNTFQKKIYRPNGRNNKPSMSIYLDGTDGTRETYLAGSMGHYVAGSYDYAVAGFSLLGLLDREIYQNCRLIYDSRREDNQYTNLHAWTVLERIRVELSQQGHPWLKIETNKGEIHIELFPHLSPRAVTHVVQLANRGFYDGTLFHSISPGRWIEGGSPLSRDDDPYNDWKGNSGTMLPGEFSDYPYQRGTVGMAYHHDSERPGASSQFFVSLLREAKWDGQFPVIGTVHQGMDIVDSISQMPLSVEPELEKLNRPENPVIIQKVWIEYPRSSRSDG